MNYSAATGSALVIGLLLAHLSPSLVVFGDSVVRQAAIVLGTVVTLLTIPLALAQFRLNRSLWIQLTTIAITIGLVEFACQYHQLSEDALVRFGMRMVAYAYVMAGWLLGAISADRRIVVPIPVQWFAAGVSLIAGLTWMRLAFASSAQGSRFTATDDLHPVGLGLLFGVSACVCFGLLSTSNWKSLRVAILPACIVMIGCILSTGSRGSLLALFCVMGLATFSRIKSVGSLLGIGFGALAALALVTAAVMFVPEVKEQFNFSLERFSRIGEADNDAALVERKEIREFYFARVADWLWLGIENYDVTRYPHNVFLELSIRFGVVLGGAIALAVLTSVVRSIVWLFKQPARDVDTVSFMVTVLGLFGFVISQFNLALEFSRMLWLFTAFWFARSTSRA